MDQPVGGTGARWAGLLARWRLVSLASEWPRIVGLAGELSRTFSQIAARSRVQATNWVARHVPATNRLGSMWPTLTARDRSRLVAFGHTAFRDSIAGLVASIVLIANIVSFAALMFPGDLSGGIPVAVWAMLIGSCIAGICIALATSLPPLATGIDSPTGAVLVMLSAVTGPPVLAAGGSPAAAVETVMLVFTIATIVSSALLYGLGVLRWASYLRFVPYFVVAGFLVATGWFLVAGGVRMSVGRTLSIAGLADGWTWVDAGKLASAVGTLAVLLLLRRWVRSALAMPAALLWMGVTMAIALHAAGLSAPTEGWYLPSLGTLTAWFPFAAFGRSHLTWAMLPPILAESLAVSIVALISILTKVASLEVVRQTSADLNREFRAQGYGGLLAVPLGGLTAGLQNGSSRLLEHAGGTTRMSGVAASLVLGAIAVANIDLPGLIPIPIAAGLVFYLGYTFIVDALWRPYVQRAWWDIALAIGIAVVCVRYGYLVGVLGGIAGACLLFAISYARIGVIRRHVTRAQFASNVDRSAEARKHLREIGDAIQVYWLAGYVFFGSSEGVFERVSSDVEALPPGRVSYVILDFALVSGADSSAMFSLAKLRNFCDQHGITLVYASLSAASRRGLELGGLLGGKGRYQVFTDLNPAVAWCENQLLAKAGLDVYTGLAGFNAWLTQQLGPAVKVDDFIAYLERKDIEGSQVLYRQGEPADCIDFVAAGGISIDLATSSGATLCVRRIITHSVIGEMGFFRHARRSATVSSDGPVILFTLTRDNFERLRRERPDLAIVFADFIACVLADRIDLANREVLALSR
jgi:sulfate permease, SulP family